MESVFTFVFAVALSFQAADALSCDSGWTAFKDELCIKVFPELLSYEAAKAHCATKGTEGFPAYLVMVKTQDMQALLENYTKNVYDSMWLGSKYDNKSSQFLWHDGTPLTYTNWQAGYPTNTSNSGHCIELRTDNGRHSGNAGAKWADVSCLRRNQVLCQKALSWTLKDAVDEIKRIRKQHEEDLDNLNTDLRDANGEISKLQQNLRTVSSNLETTTNNLNIVTRNLQATTNNLTTVTRDLATTNSNLNTVTRNLATVTNNLQTVSARVVPVGFIYIEYYNQPSPRTLWPGLTWQDISGTYAGLFFRVTGGGSGSWGSTQAECAPRITHMERQWSRSDIYPNPLTIPANGWSVYGHNGDSYTSGTRYYEGSRFYTQGCEVRPKNQAVRIWKRTG